MLINMRDSVEMLVTPSSGVDLINSLGLEARFLGGRTLQVEEEAFHMHTRQRVPSPAELKRQATQHSIYFLPRISGGLRKFASENKAISLVADRTGEFWHNGEQVNAPKSNGANRAQPARAPWARFGLLRALAMSSTPRTQSELASSLWITQAAISQNLATLRHLVEKTTAGWRAKEIEMVLQAFLDDYPGPSGVERYWYGTEPVPKQVAKIAASRPSAIMSGDFAADQMAAWRIPDLGVFYSESDLKLDELGFISTQKEKATIVEIVPFDRTVFALAKEVNGLKLADPLTVAYDMRRSQGVDTPEAIEHLLSDLKARWNQRDH